MQEKNKLLIICGPTATGKTRLGVDLAKKFNGEIVSADSRQVYQGMDIGTGKDVVTGVKIWLLDLVKPDYRFNVADFKKQADVVLADICKRGKLPIVVGGTGFYIKALTEGIESIGVKPDWELRNKLQGCKISELQRILEDYSPERSQKMNESDKQNPRRLIRAIEIARNYQLPITNRQSLKLDALFIGLSAPNKILYQRIDQRVNERVKNGMAEEIKGLLAKGYTWENSALGVTLAYKEWQEYFEGKKTKEEIIQKWQFDEHDYARRQMTWFKKNKKINWFEITEKSWQTEVEKKVESWYS